MSRTRRSKYLKRNSAYKASKQYVVWQSVTLFYFVVLNFFFTKLRKTATQSTVLPWQTWRWWSSMVFLLPVSRRRSVWCEIRRRLQAASSAVGRRSWWCLRPWDCCICLAPLYSNTFTGIIALLRLTYLFTYILIIADADTFFVRDKM